MARGGSRACLVGCGVLLILCFVAGWVLFADDPPPDDDDLQPTPRPLYSAEDSVWVGLMEFHDRLPEQPPFWTWEQEYGERLADEGDDDDPLGTGTDPWRPSPIDTSPPTRQLFQEMTVAFEGSRGELEELERILTLPTLGIPPKDPLDPVPGVTEVREVFLRSFDRALLARLRGDVKGCVDELLLSRMVGSRMVRGPSPFLVARIGIAFVNRSESAVESLLHDPLPSDGWERRWLAQDVLFAETGALFAETLRVDYSSMPELIEEARTTSFWAPVAFKKNRTLARIAESYRALIERAEQSPWERTEMAEVEDGKETLSRSLRQRNVGEGFVELFTSGFDEFLADYDEGALREQACRTLLALRIYDRRHGALPPDLDTLVAAIEDYGAVPIDPFSGRSLQYDRDLRIIYSVGENGIDEGGACWEEALRRNRNWLSLPDIVWFLPELSDR